MANKNHPGPFNCHAAALPDEPIFTLLGRDPAAPETIRDWAFRREAMEKNTTQEDRDRIDEAIHCASDMEKWRDDNIDPTPGGTASWRLPRNQVTEDDAPVAEKDVYAKVAAAIDAATVDANIDMGTHYQAWRAAINQCIACAPEPFEDQADRAYWQHELRAFDRAFTALGYTDRPVGSKPGLAAAYGNVKTFNDTLNTRDDLARKPDVPAHRFAIMHKGERYAYAKGLEVNPSHLPKALDAMAKDGWFLLSIFGQTDSAHVGFIFERREATHRPQSDQSDQMDAYGSKVPIEEIMGMGRGLEP